MKLKEIPGSVWRAGQLLRIPRHALVSQPNSLASGCIISLTSIPSRIPILHLTVRSLLSQQLGAERVVLWLHKDLKQSLPRKLTCLISDRFEIHYSEQTCAHRKLVESLKHFPDKIIVTSDDDMMYPVDWLQCLWQEHLDYPQDIVANECRHISTDALGQLLGYKQWRGESPGVSSPETLAIGYSGVLYPVNSLPDMVLDDTLYNRLAPRADDLWFKAMSLKNGTRTRRVRIPARKPTPILFSQRVSLKKHNVRDDGNLPQWRALDEEYELMSLMAQSSSD